MISTHVLDTSKGLPAAGVVVSLMRKKDDGWQTVSSGVTNADGRFAFEHDVTAEIYQIVFEIEQYLKKNGSEYFFLSVPVIFKIADVTRKYHVPLLLNPFGYSTYRGS